MNLRDIHISQLVYPITDEYVGALDIPMEDRVAMQDKESLNGMAGGLPYFSFRNMNSSVSNGLDFLLKVAFI